MFLKQFSIEFHPRNLTFVKHMLF